MKDANAVRSVQRARASKTLFPFVLLIACTASLASAQPPPKPYVLSCERKEFVDERYLCKGQVEFVQGDVKLYADELEYFESLDKAIARGNVVFSEGRNQIAADRADFNTKTRLGVFYSATGITNIKPPRPAEPAPGMFVAPQMTGQETDIYFFGETVEKTGPKKYKITNGGFTTCVQPTPRWDLHAGSITLNVDDYALLWNSVFKVKGVPMFYLPVMYHPTNKEGRSTGFLLPTWGMSSLNGQSIGNQFFWAISRSQDASFMHDWYSRLGQGGGAEYRYDAGSGTGNVTSYLLNRKELTYAGGFTSPAERSFKVVGSANQALPHRLRARADVNYFSSVGINQTFMTNIADFSQNRRTYGGNVAGSWGRYSLNGTFQRSEWFNSLTSSGVTGSSPLLSLSQGEKPLFAAASPLYFSFDSEVAHLDRQTRAVDVVTDDRSLGRIDFSPRLRYPFKHWQWLTVNSSLAWRDTFYTRSQDPISGTVLDDNLNRQFFAFQADLSGPIFNRLWDTPDNGYAEKFKHTIEPFLGFQRTTLINNFDRVVAGVDGGLLGGVTSYAYGVNNRLYAKRRIGQVSQAQQIVSVAIIQTYYTDSRAAQLDPNYGTSFTGAQPSKFSPIKVDLSVYPATGFNGSVRAEIDPRHRELRTLSAGARHIWSGGATDVSWNQRFFIADLDGFNNPDFVSRSLNAASNAHTRDNRYGAIYNFTYDAVRSIILQQSIQGYYNAQCCGLSFQYSRANYLNNLVVNNNKFLFSFTLAGLGSFSPFDGGLGGVPH